MRTSTPESRRLRYPVGRPWNTLLPSCGRCKPQPQPEHHPQGQQGAAVIQVLLSVCIGLLFILLAVNAALMLYGRSVVQHAADVGARTGGRAGLGSEISTCRDAAQRTISQLAALFTPHTSVVCRQVITPGGGRLVTALIRAHIPPIFDGLGPRWDFTLRSSSLREATP